MIRSENKGLFYAGQKLWSNTVHFVVTPVEIKIKKLCKWSAIQFKADEIGSVIFLNLPPPGPFFHTHTEMFSYRNLLKNMHKKKRMMKRKKKKKMMGWLK